ARLAGAVRWRPVRRAGWPRVVAAAAGRERELGAGRLAQLVAGDPLDAGDEIGRAAEPFGDLVGRHPAVAPGKDAPLDRTERARTAVALLGVAALPHLIGQAFALEDVTAREADARLDVGRTEDLALDHALGDVRREAGDRLEHAVADLVAARVPGPGGERVRRVLGEHAHRLGAGGRDARVVGGLEVDLAPLGRRFTAAALFVRRLRVVDPPRDLDLGPVHVI